MTLPVMPHHCQSRFASQLAGYRRLRSARESIVTFVNAMFSDIKRLLDCFPQPARLTSLLAL